MNLNQCVEEVYVVVSYEGLHLVAEVMSDLMEEETQLVVYCVITHQAKVK